SLPPLPHHSHRCRIALIAAASLPPLPHHPPPLAHHSHRCRTTPTAAASLSPQPHHFHPCRIALTAPESLSPQRSPPRRAGSAATRSDMPYNPAPPVCPGGEIGRRKGLEEI